MAARKDEKQLPDSQDMLAEGLGYAIKRRLLGKPLVNEQLSEERLSKPMALGVLAPDGISSSAYGTEEILIELLKGGLAVTAFALILPLTGAVLFVMTLVVLSYREVVTVYTRAGGSYVVARENLGPRVAQVAAVALLIDYVVTVAVQVSAGTAAVASAAAPYFSIFSSGAFLTGISIAIVLLMLYGNLRGIREASRAFAAPTYLFSGVMILTIVVGLVREFFFNGLPQYHAGLCAYGKACASLHIPAPAANHDSLITFGLIFILLRAFANGGSSLTGIEAVSNAVSVFRPSEGINARKVLVAEGLILGTLVAGISWLAHVTHATPYQLGVPTVISQEARLVFGASAFGTVMFILVQAVTALILYTGGNTSFNGFPFLASFVAEDAFLPRWLTKRGHRLVFSNGIVVLAVLAITLLAVAGSVVNNLVPLYAIGVFTAFTLAGLGMARYHHRERERGWRHKLVINFSAGVTSLVVVLIFVVVKFTEGAWVVVVLFVIGVPVLIRLNRHYQMEAEVLERIGTRRGEAAGPPSAPTYARRTVYVFVDDFDLATLAALRYARSLRPTSLRAVHFVIDNVQSTKLREDWLRANTGVVLDLIDCPDRRLARAAAEMVQAEAMLAGVGVTAVLPRRSYAPIVGRLLHDRTADKIAAVISQIPHAAATIVPFDVRSRVESLAARAREREQRAAETPGDPPRDAGQGASPDADRDQGHDLSAVASTRAGPQTAEPDGDVTDHAPAPAAYDPMPSEPITPAMTANDGSDYNRPVPSARATPIGQLANRGRAVVEGRVHAVEIRPVERNTVLACEIVDSTGQLTAMFYGRSYIPGLNPGAKVRLIGQVGIRDRKPVMINPAYELLTYGADGPASS